MLMSKKSCLIATTTLSIAALCFVKLVQTVPCAEIPIALRDEYTLHG